MKIDILSLIRLKASLSKSFHIQPSEVDKMPMWEYEIYIKQLNELVEEENEQQKKDMDEYNIKDYKKMTNPKNIQNMSNHSMPKMPNMSTPKLW